MNNIVNHPLPKNTTHKEFFNSLRYFHDKVRDLKETIIRYVLDKGLKCEREFFAVLLENNEVTEVSKSVYYDVGDFVKFKEAIELWANNQNENVTLFSNFYKLDLEDKILIFGSFQDIPNHDNACTDNEKVLAGFILPNTIDSRMLIFSLSNRGISHLKEKTYNVLHEAIG